ncbi:hypothetical protein JQ604_10645 [Bradyrhizobium jicamae]|uniref:hypothetical protein n=1 Tax=Bradyrhizobium jicamae TaxID=280332 RepID=UPI001BA8D891|nr:hypothetical protein [Bradyrhizobium jicamae]MBR0752643.1 hypothetical protein [Bradyrhizobium jicamae]
MASVIVDLMIGVVELAFLIVMKTLPAVCFFTAVAVVYATTLGKVTVEFPATGSKIGWTGIPRVTRSPQGKTVLSPALGVIIGFIVWVIIASAVVALQAYRA